MTKLRTWRDKYPYNLTVDLLKAVMKAMDAGDLEMAQKIVALTKLYQRGNYEWKNITTQETEKAPEVAVEEVLSHGVH